MWTDCPTEETFNCMPYLCETGEGPACKTCEAQGKRTGQLYHALLRLRLLMLPTLLRYVFVRGAGCWELLEAEIDKPAY